MTEKKPDPQKHERINDILLGPIERPVIAWIVRRLPAWVTPDILTYTGLVAAFIVLVSYLLSSYNIAFLWLASFGFFLNWFGDSLDGNLARYRKIERPKYGFFIDHSIDAITQVTIFLGMGLSPFVDFRIACLALIGYLMLEILVMITTYVRGVFQISYGKLGPTEIRVLAILVNTYVFFFGDPIIRLPFGDLGFFNLIFLVVAVLLVVIFLISMSKNAAELAEQEKIEKAVALKALAETDKTQAEQ